MTDFLHSLKADLLDRRFLPVLALVGVALIAALAYAILGGSSSTSSTPPAPSAAATGAGRAAGAVVAVTQAPAVNQAVSETTSGAHHHASAPRNPFAPLPGANKSTSTSSSNAAKGSSSASGKSTPSSGGTTPATTPKATTTPVKTRYYIHFHVSAAFGVVPPAAPGAPPQPAQLKTYADMPLGEPLPDKANPQLVYLGVVLRTGKEAVFAITGEPILHGSAVCKPSPSQCQGIELRAGQSERLEVADSSGQTVTYELKLLSIAKTISTKASVARAHSKAARAGRALLGHNGVPTLSDLRLTAFEGGLVPLRRPAFTAHAAQER
jgi:hypothetical protein